MQVCRYWGRDLQWFNAQPKADKVLYLAEWNARAEDSKKGG